ncbi:HAMP domain-containing histidine kinase [Vibrio sp. 404]|uniref:histidine kinase n=1 Tax=Vibrio marinisediminis TaxID=2758441 RepID=A0A7W2ISP1_9VIBR|nr:HAMP domain-containing sensor histidine kinase [Vibrio marinisediminis]MBA5761736.1 HAMP domain-containing histidine kinase [Vibrio marinisediminis]
MIITFVVFIHLTSDYVRAGDRETFLDTATLHLQRYINSQHELAGLYQQLQHKRELTFYDYKLHLISQQEDIEQFCADCVLFTQHQGFDLYINDLDLLATVLPVPNSTQRLLYIETEDPISVSTPWYQDRDNHFFLMLFITMSIALAALLYFPIQRVNRRINKLLYVQEAFGQGDLKARADAYHISPIKEIAQSFNEMADDIETRVKESQIFLQAIPHEIRTPLSRIQMANDLLRSNYVENRPALHDRIDDYIEDISLLTSDIIQLSRLTNKRCAKDAPLSNDISLPDLCAKRIEMINSSANIKLNIDTELSSLQPIGADCFAKLILDNLIKNAIAYGKGVIEVSLNEFECCWTIDVEDNGHGIPNDMREEIFIAFSRLDKSRNVNSGGFGLGLAIANQAAKNLGWQLSVCDSHLGGARFTIVIPKFCD